jgi:hypothetical protein
LRSAIAWDSNGESSRSGSDDSRASGSKDSRTRPAPADRRSFPPEVALHVVKIACELPDSLGRSLSQWDSVEIARKLVDDGIVESISPDTVWRILDHHKLKPWRHKMWMSDTVPRDAAFKATVLEIADLYTRQLRRNEVVLCLDEKTSIQPRPRKSPTRPARPGRPIQLESEYKRAGALNLFAAFDTRTGKVWGQCHERKRQVEFIPFLEMLDAEFPPSVTTIHIVLDNVRMHKGKLVQAWLAKNPRFKFHFPPVHCSWMNQVEQWFSIIQKKRLGLADFGSKEILREKILQYIAHYNEHAHPFNWTTKSVAKVMAQCDANAA